MVPLPNPSRTGVRITGDQYQWLAGWRGCLEVLGDRLRRAENPVVAVGVEVNDAGSLDDVVYWRKRPPHTYMQVKYAVDASTPVNEEFLFSRSRNDGPALIAKFLDTWRKLVERDGKVDPVLRTSRTPDSHDPLVSVRDTRTQLLLPRAAEGGPGTDRGAARARWARSLNVSEAELLALLRELRFDTAWDLDRLRADTALMMRSVGLRDDRNALDLGINWVANQVRDGHRELDYDRIVSASHELGIDDAGRARSVVSVATLKPDPLAGSSDHALDWVDRFDGAVAQTKRRPAFPATWRELQDDIESVPHALPSGISAVTVNGSFRQATGFMIGAAFRGVTGFDDVSMRQRGAHWSTAYRYERVIEPVVTEHDLGLGDEVAVLVAVATAPVNAVRDFIRAQELPVDRLLVCQPPTGARDDAVPDAATALGLAVGIRDAVRGASGTGRRPVHLFLAGPGGLAMLLGNRWNRIAATTVYEDVHEKDVPYEAAFHVNA